MAKQIVRALRLPFILASTLPFIFGSLIARDNFNFFNFLLGLISVACLHLSANLINDYADSKSGADWKDKRYYNFFGGSKLIQEGLFSEKFYLRLAIFFAVISCLSLSLLAVRLNSMQVIIYYLVILALAWLYSTKPLQLSYRRLGEPVIFLVFGPAVVMGGYFIQTGIFPDLRSFFLSLPFGFLTAAILFSNEVPDFCVDQESAKFTAVSFFGREDSYKFYLLLTGSAFLAVIINAMLGFLNVWALLALLLVFPVLKASFILKRFYDDKVKLMQSSQLTISAQALAGLILIFSLFL